MKQKFIDFLKENDAFEAFCENLTIPLDNYLGNEEPEDYLISNFPWHETEQGVEFWHALSLLWLDILEAEQ